MMRDLVGDTLSERYRVVARIAGGGMGEVYRGHDLLLDRSVAIKVLQPTLANDPELVARFRAEARAAARLSHPNVVAVHDWGQEDDRTYYMIMEYVSGTDLRDVLVGRGPVDPKHACDIVVSVCEALAAAHATGLVHRDVKPENVLIARDGTIKVADFGIAAVADAERTMPGGSILGTLRYLSPEQAAGRDASPASDIWATGAVLFELLTGSAPSGGSGAELLRRRAEEGPVPPSQLEPEVPQALDAVVMKSCALDPLDRYESAQEMARAVREIGAGLGRRERQVKELLVDLTGEVRLPGALDTEIGGREAYLGRRRRRTRLRVLRYSMVLLLLPALAFGGWKTASALMGPSQVDVPRFQGLTLTEARDLARDSDLEVTVTESRHETVPEGSVIAQDPTGGTILEGGSIALVVSKGPPLVKVPKLSGKPVDRAVTRLEALGLVVEETTYVFSVSDEADTIIRVDAAGQRIEKGSGVALFVSKGPRLAPVPDVVGMKAATAEAELRSRGFEVALVDVYSDDVRAGRVVSTTPSTGTQAEEGSTIQVSVSIGPEFKKVTMPDVRNMSVGPAKAELRGLGLRPVVRQSCPGSTVVETSPIPGTTVRENDRVVLFVC